MTFEDHAEALAAVAVVAVGADRMGTVEEHRFILETMSGMEPFAEMTQDAFARLIRDVTDNVCDTFPNDGQRITDDGVADLTSAIAAALTEEQCVEALEMATALCRSDGMHPSEIALLERLRDGLGVDPHVARELFGEPS